MVRRTHHLPLWLIGAALWIVCVAVMAVAAPLSADSQRQYDTTIKPFLEAHCYKCHDDKKTRAGFRIDTLGTDFLADKNADNWKEIYDKIGLGKMPPKKEPRPTADEARVVTDWIDEEIRSAERRARISAGRTRRLNRTEYFNTLRDLFFLDEEYVRSLEDELPPDARVDGFDRVGSSLYIDQSQLAKYFEIADRVLNERVLAPKPKAAKSVKDFARHMIWRPEYQDGKATPVQATERYAMVFGTYPTKLGALPPGARIYEMKNGGIEYLAGGKDSLVGLHDFHGAATAGGGNWSPEVYAFFSKITQEGKYRLTFRAGAFAGAGKYAVEDVKLMFNFSKGNESGTADRGSIVIDAPLDKPRDYVMEIYLHPKPEVGGSNRCSLKWNGGPAYQQERVDGVVIQNGLILQFPEIFEFESNALAKYDRMIIYEPKRNGTPPEKVNEMYKSLRKAVTEEHAKLVQAYFGANKPAYVYNPAFDLASVPRLFLESWEVEGPIVEWPPRGRTELLFAGEDRPIDDSYIREIFARFLPRAYRRAVEPKELETVVSYVLKAQKDDKLCGMDAVREGVKAVLCSPDFLMIEEPTALQMKEALSPGSGH